MTDAELNRAVAEARGAYVYHYDKDYRENCYYLLLDGDGNTIAPFDPALGIRTGYRATEAQAWADAPNVCTDPAAWGALFTWLAGEGWEVLLVWLPELGRCDARVKKIDWQAFARSKIGEATDSKPGRALALAFLKAVQP